MVNTILTTNKSETRYFESEKIPAINKTLQYLEDLSTLPENWDSYGASAPQRRALIGAAALATNLFDERTDAPSIFPVPNGNIQFEWSSQHMEIEVEIESSSHCTAYIENFQSGVIREESFRFDFTELREALLEISDHNNRPLLQVV